jgi:hypothetical protein
LTLSGKVGYREIIRYGYITEILEKATINLLESARQRHVALRQLVNFVTIFLDTSTRTLARKKRAGKLARVRSFFDAVFAAFRAVQFCSSRAVRIPIVPTNEAPNASSRIQQGSLVERREVREKKKPWADTPPEEGERCDAQAQERSDTDRWAAEFVKGVKLRI